MDNPKDTVENLDTIEKIKKPGSNLKLGIGIGLLLLAISVPLTVTTLNQRTVARNNAAGFVPTIPPIPSRPSLPAQAITNLNSATDIVAAINADGTMGPQTSYGNWSNSLPDFLKGKLVFVVTDSGNQVKGVSNAGNPNVTHPVKPTHTFPTQAQGKMNGNQGNGKTTEGDEGKDKDKKIVTALNLTITKVEVHIAYQGTPGERVKTTETTPDQKGQVVDHWETLTLPTPVTVDLVQLAKTNSFSTLGLTTLAAGRYTQVRLYVKSATATFSDGTTVGLQILGRDNIVKIVQSFTIQAEQTTKLTLDFDAQRSVVQANGQYHLKPVVAHLKEEKQ